jgi:hypothetical protein
MVRNLVIRSKILFNYKYKIESHHVNGPAHDTKLLSLQDRVDHVGMLRGVRLVKVVLQQHEHAGVEGERVVGRAPLGAGVDFTNQLRP